MNAQIKSSAEVLTDFSEVNAILRAKLDCIRSFVGKVRARKCVELIPSSRFGVFIFPLNPLVRFLSSIPTLSFMDPAACTATCQVLP
jgi:hypothetical protein